MEDFFTKGRRQLQRLCKKHGIPANLKNIEMAEKLTLIYKEKENENPVPRQLRTVIDESNREIIVLDSDSVTEVQMEAPDIVSVAEKDSNEMSNVNVDQFLATSSLSKVDSSDLNIRRMVDSDSVAEKNSNERTNVDELHSSGLKYSVGEPDQFLVTSPLSEVKSSDLNIHHMVYSGTAAGHVDACEVISGSLQTTSQEREESTLELSPEKSDNVGTFYVGENMEMSVNVLEHFGNHMMMGENSYGTPVQFLLSSDLNIHKMVVKDPEECIRFSPKENNQEDCIPAQGEDIKLFDNSDVAEKDCKEKTDVAAKHFQDEVHPSGLKYSVGEPDQFLTTSPLSEMKFSDLNIHQMVDSGTVAGNADACEVKSVSLQESMMTLQCERSDNNVGSILEENAQMSVNKEQIEDNQELSPATPTDLDVLQMVDSGTAAGHADGCEVKSACLQGREEAKKKLTPERCDDGGTFYVVGNKHLSVNAEQIEDNLELNQAAPSKCITAVVEECGNYMMMEEEDLDEIPVQCLSTRGDNVGTFYVEENKHLSVNAEQIEDNLELNQAAPIKCITVVVEECGNYMMMEEEDLDEIPVQCLSTRGDNVGTFYVEENKHLSVNAEQIEDNLELNQAAPIKCITAVVEECGNYMMMEEEDLDGIPVQCLSTRGDNVGTFYVEENKHLSVNAEQIEDNLELNQAAPSKCIKAVVEECGNYMMMEEEDLDEIPVQCLSTRGDNVGTFYVEENKHLSVNAEQIEDNLELNQAAPIKCITVVVEECGNYMMMEEEDLDEIPVQCLSTRGDNVGTFYVEENKHLSVNAEQIEDNLELNQAAPIKCITAVVEECGNYMMMEEEDLDGIPVQCLSTRGDNVGTFYVEENKHLSVNAEQIEDNLELNQAAPSKCIKAVVEECGNYMMMEEEDLDEIPVQCLSTRGDNVGTFYVEENKHLSVNAEQIEDNLELNQAAPSKCIQVVEECGNYMMMEEEDLDEIPVQCRPNSGDNVGTFYVEENKHLSVNAEQIEGNLELNQAAPSKCIKVVEEFGNNMMMEEDSDEIPVQCQPTSGDNVGTFYVEENKHFSVNTEQTKDNLELNQALDLLQGLLRSVISDEEVKAGTVAGNADACEVKSVSLQQTSQFQEESKMTLQCERSENIVGFILEENAQMSVDKEQIEDNQELSPATTNDLDVFHLGDSGSAAGHADGCEVKSASLPGREEAKKKLTPERCDNGGTFYVEENKHLSVNAEQIEDNLELNQAAPSKCIKVVEECGNYMMMEEEDLDEIPVQCQPTSGDNSGTFYVEENNLELLQGLLHCAISDEEGKAAQRVPTVSQPGEMMPCNFSLQQLFATDTCEEELLKLSEEEKTCMVADLEECVGFPPNYLEAATTKGYESDRKESDCISAQGEVSKFFDNTDFGADVLIQTVPQPSEIESCDFNLQQLFSLDTTSGDEDAYQKKLDSPIASVEKNMIFSPELRESKMTFQCERSSDNVGSFCFEDNKQISVIMEPIEDDEELTLELHHAAPTDHVNVLEGFVGSFCFEDNKQMGVIIEPIEDDEELTLELYHAAPTDHVNVLEGFVGSFCFEDNKQMGVIIEPIEDDEELTLELYHGAPTDHVNVLEGFVGPFCFEDNKQMGVIIEPIEDNEELTPAPREENLELHHAEPTDDVNVLEGFVGSFCFEDNKQMSVIMEPIEDNEELSLVPREENLELHHAAPTDDVNVLEEFGNYMLVGEDSDGRSVQFLPTSDLEASATKTSFDQSTPEDVMETDTMKESMQIDKMEKENNQGGCISDQGEVSKFFDNSAVYDDISGVGAGEENQPQMTSRKRKSSDKDYISANLAEDVKADEFVPAVPQPSETESYNFSLEQLFAADNAFGDEEAYKTKLDSPKLEMSLPQKRERDNSVGTCDMKENIKIDMKEDAGLIMSKTKFAKTPKRQPLQDLIQN